jgi:hypothetical protein
MPQMRAEDRFIIAMTIIVVVIVAIAAIGYLTGRWETQP